MEFPEESLAHYHCRAGDNRVAVRMALLDLPKQCLLPDIRRQSLPSIGPGSQRRLWNLLSLNSHLPLPWNEKNPNSSGARSPRQKEGPTEEDTKAASTAFDFATQNC